MAHYAKHSITVPPPDLVLKVPNKRENWRKWPGQPELLCLKNESHQSQNWSQMVQGSEVKQQRLWRGCKTKKGAKESEVGLRTEFLSSPPEQESRECNGLLASRMSGTLTSDNAPSQEGLWAPRLPLRWSSQGHMSW